ncbi:phosphodiester glycosidase family protein [Shimia sp.]|uniref:phosphodiester glycosidase family protein n=1 Tax=Shimia sp. TaxID=1954381 RepID=UPI0032969A5C
MKPVTFALTLLTFLAPQLAYAVTCQDTEYLGNSYTVCEVDAAREDLRLFLKDDSGDVLGQFSRVARALPETQVLSFAMNAGMYHPDRAPVGHYVEDGQPVARLLTGASKGNFGLLPNGVFCIRPDRADVFETLRFEREAPDCRFATQSGPMLVIDGELHPRFLPDGTSRHVRNGVGTSDDGQRVVFAISNNRVTFHEFGSFFRDALNKPNALFFDGKVSRLHAPQIDRSDAGFWMGPIVGVVTAD